MNVEIINCTCPICGSENVRSKVHNGDQWWYVCDNMVNEDHVLLLDGETINMEERFYFTESGDKIEYKGEIYSAE